MASNSGAYPSPTLTLSLRGGTVQIELFVAMPASTISALEQQIARRRTTGSGPWTDFSKAFREAVHRVLDDDLKEPTDADLRLATRLARAQGVDIPNEAISYRVALRRFVAELRAIHDDDAARDT